MNVKYCAIFILFAVLMLAAGWMVESTIVRVLFAYVAFSFLAYGVAYALRAPRVWQKRDNGTINPLSFLLFAPMHGLNWLALLLAVRLKKEEPYNEIVKNLWLGRRLISTEADFFAQKPDIAVLDLTCEFPENSRLRNKNYLCLLVLDHTAPGKDQLKRATAFIRKHILERPVYVHCALGHGRSATAVAAWLLEENKGQTVEAAVKQIKAIRPGVKLEGGQALVLNESFQN